MSYIMTQWQNGQEPAINAENLNKIERGIYDAHQTAEGKYSKPSLGIPKNDLAESVKNSLDNADSALQDDDVDSALSLISTNPVQNKVITNKIASTDRRLNALYKLTQGQAWDFDRDDNNAYSVDVPSGAKYASVDMVGGKSVAWNQMGKELNATNWVAEKGATISFEDDVIVVSSTTANNGAISVTHSTFKNEHKYLVTSKVKTETDLDYVVVGSAQSSGVTKVASIQAGQWVDNSYVAQSVVDGKVPLYCYARGTQYSNLRVKYFMIFDLTQMFGSTIADYIYSLEQSQAGAGVAWFKKLFPNDYYPYCEPTIISSQTDRVDVRGKNLFNPVDKETSYTKLEVIGNTIRLTAKSNSDGTASYFAVPTRISVVAGKTVFVSVGEIIKSKETLNAVVYVSVNDENGNRIGNFNNNKAYQLPTNAKSIDVYLYADAGSGTAKIGDYIEYHNVQVEYATSATAYSPYSLQQIETGFTVLNSAGSVYDYIDLNEGKLHQRVGKAVFDGSESWRVNTSATAFYLEKANLPNKKQGSMLSAMSNRYSYGGTAGASSGTANGSFRFYNNSNPNINDEIYVNDTSLADVAALKASLANNPLTIIYELAEEIVTDIEIPAELADWLTVEAGGSITFHNVDEGKRLLIPSTEEYLVKLSEVISNG